MSRISPEIPDSRFQAGMNSKDGKTHFFINRLMINDKGTLALCAEGATCQN